MSELGCFVSLGAALQEADSVATFKPMNSKAVKASMTFKVDKSKLDKPIDTIFFGYGPAPKYRKRFAREDGRGIKLGNTYDECCILLARILNACNIKVHQAQTVLDRIGSLRYLEGILNRSKDKDDVAYQNDQLLKRMVGICFGLTKEKETTLTTESSDIVFMNEFYTVTKLSYSKYTLTENRTDEFKITLNSLDVKPTDHATRDVNVYCTYNHNKYMIINHGKGHWRVVPFPLVLSHVERVYNTYQVTKTFTQESELSHRSWSRAMEEMINGKPLSRVKEEALSRSNLSNKAVKQEIKERMIDEMSVVGQ